MDNVLYEKAQRLVRNEVHYCVSSLVHTLAKAAHGAIASPDHRNPYLNDAISETMHLCDQAAKLAAPILDYEEAAREEGWRTADLTPGMFVNDSMADAETGAAESFHGDWVDLCSHYGIEPHYREVFEHWIVSDWLADKLAEKGEKVDKDFAGLVIWARTTTGQAICMDHVIQQIAKDLADA